MKSQLYLKRKLGQKLSEYRHNHHLRLEHVTKRTGIPWQRIDRLELGEETGWPVYKRLLEFYNLEAMVELTEKVSLQTASGRAKNCNPVN